MKHPVEVAAKPPLVPAAIHELNEPELLERVEVPLDSPDRPVQDLCQRLHLWPTQPRLVVGVVC